MGAYVYLIDDQPFRRQAFVVVRIVIGGYRCDRIQGRRAGDRRMRTVTGGIRRQIEIFGPFLSETIVSQTVDQR